MFFIFSIVELILVVAGIASVHDQQFGAGIVMILIGVLMFILTSVRYIQRTNGNCFDCDCGPIDDSDCSFFEGFACAECLDAGSSGLDCNGLDCDGIDCDGIDCN